MCRRFAYVQKQLVHATHKLRTGEGIEGRHRRAHTRTSASQRHTQLVWMRNARTIMNMNVVHVRAGLCACVYGMWHVSADYITCITCQRNRAAQQQNKNRKEEDRKEKSLNNGTKQCTRVNFFERGVRLLHTHTRTHTHILGPKRFAIDFILLCCSCTG